MGQLWERYSPLRSDCHRRSVLVRTHTLVSRWLDPWFQLSVSTIDPTSHTSRPSSFPFVVALLWRARPPVLEISFSDASSSNGKIQRPSRSFSWPSREKDQTPPFVATALLVRRHSVARARGLGASRWKRFELMVSSVMFLLTQPQANPKRKWRQREWMGVIM